LVSRLASKVVSVKGRRQESAGRRDDAVTSEIGENHCGLRASQLENQLATGATRRNWSLRGGDDDDPEQIARPFRDRLAQCDPLCTKGQTITGILNIAPREEAAVATLYHCPDRKI